MIRRRRGEQFLLIDQHDHALLSGELAKRVGNAMFAPPSPYEAVVAAIAQHDIGWHKFDRAPARNAQGFPAHIFESEPDTALAAWADSVQCAAARDPYTQLLVSLHTMALAELAMHPTLPIDADSARRRVFIFNRFIQKQIEVQETLRKKLGMRTDLPLRCGLAVAGEAQDEDLLMANFHLLQLLDRLSLVLCFDEALFQNIGPVYPRPGAASVSVRLERDGPGVVRVDPWPFDRESIALQVTARVIAARVYPDDAELHAACAAATVETIALRVQNWNK